LQNDVRQALRTRYFTLRGWQLRHAAQIAAWEVELPRPLAARLEPLVEREIAAVLWRTKQAILVTPFARQELVYLHTYLANRCNPWSISIGHIVKRNPTFTTTGDASNLGGGAHCRDLRFWFSYIWSPEICRRANLPKKHPDKIHINCLEFAVALIQLAATITRMEEE
jgi:hypothetical protein